MGKFISSQALYQQILEALDKDCNNYIDYTEFLTAAVSKEKLLTKQNLRTAFNLFDTDRSGQITLEELKKVFDMSGRKDAAMWAQIMEEVDQDKDGQISYHEFEAVMDEILSEECKVNSIIGKKMGQKLGMEILTK